MVIYHYFEGLLQRQLLLLNQFIIFVERDLSYGPCMDLGSDGVVAGDTSNALDIIISA